MEDRSNYFEQQNEEEQEEEIEDVEDSSVSTNGTVDSSSITPLSSASVTSLSVFASPTDSISTAKRFNQRYRIKGHLSAGAHGIILWAIDRQPNQSSLNQQPYFHHHHTDSPQPTFEDLSLEDDSKTTANPNAGSQFRRGQFAIKRIFIRNRVVSISIVREIKTLQFLRGHPNIVDLVDVCPFGSSLNLIFPLLPLNLATLIYEIGLNSTQCAIYCRMLASSVSHLHRNGVIHRDLKPSNLLIDWNGILKLCDFGQARAIDVQPNGGSSRSSDNTGSELSYQVCTRWYRAPELLYGSSRYDYSVDLWSVGCILAELLQEWPLFKGENDIEQLSLVVNALGQPKPEWTVDWPDFNKIQFASDADDAEETEDTPVNLDEDSRKVVATKRINWLDNLQQKCKLNRFSEQARDLLGQLCRYADRIDADKLLQHPYLNQQIKIDNSEHHLVSIGDMVANQNNQHLMDRYLVKAKYVKHLSGPPRNDQD